MLKKIENVNEIMSGKCQFNSTEAKSFRATLAKWHNATFKIADESLKMSEDIKSLDKLIVSDTELINKLRNGESIIGNATVESLEAEIKSFTDKITAKKTALKELREAQKTRIEKAESLVSEELYSAYADAAVDISKRDNYVIAMANFLTENKIVPAIDTINALIAAVGKKTASSRQQCKSGKHNTTITNKQYKKLVIGELCDIMGDLLPVYKFSYILKENRKSEEAPVEKKEEAPVESEETK